MLEGLGVRRWLRRFNGPFGSSAGVALTSQFPEGGSVVVWVRDGRHVVLAYVIGFFVMLAPRGWSPMVS